MDDLSKEDGISAFIEIHYIAPTEDCTAYQSLCSPRKSDMAG
jgi:hypothetical protein